MSQAGAAAAAAAAAVSAGAGGAGNGGGSGSVNTSAGTLKELALKTIVLQSKKALTAAAVERADAILPRDKEGRQYVKQGVIDALVKDNRLLDDTVPLCFFEPDQRRLSFRGASKITEALLAAVCPAVPALEYLDLSGCFMLGDSAIPLVLQACPALRSLKLENCRKLTDATLRHVVERGRSIQAVNVGGGFNMTEDGLLLLVTQHPNRHSFKELYLSGLTFGPALLEAVCAECPKMRHLGLGYSDAALTEEALLTLLRALRLRKLHVHWCQEAVTDRVLEAIGEECPDLEELNICGCKRVTSQGIEQLLAKRNPPSDAMDIDGSGGAGGGGHDDLPPSPSKKGRGSGKRLRKLKLRYATTSRPQIKAIEEAWGGGDVDFPH